MAMLVAEVPFDLCSFMELNGHLSRLQGGAQYAYNCEAAYGKEQQVAASQVSPNQRTRRMISKCSKVYCTRVKTFVSDPNIYQ